MGKLKRKITELDDFTIESSSKEQLTDEKLLKSKQKFVDNFIYDFTEEELAAKHTLETIFKKCHSFGYTYKCIKEALDLDPVQIGYFAKAIAVVADLQLIELNKSQNVFDTNFHEPSANDDKKNILIDSPTEYETDGHSNVEFFQQKEQSFYQSLDAVLCNLVQNTHIPIPMDTDGKYNINDVDWYVNQLECGVLSKLLPFGQEFLHNIIKITKSNNIGNLLKFSQESNFLIYTLQRGNGIITHWISKILNKSETSGTSLFDNSEIEWQEANNRNCIDVLIKLFDLAASVHNDIQSYEMARDKLKRLEKIENESIEHKRKLESDRIRKLNSKRNAVTFILERRSEYDKLSANSKMKHPFYILGQDVRKSSVSSLKRFSKKLKSLLHPDTETDPQWKEKCENSFKEASLALDLCMELLKNPTKLSHCTNGPIIDFFDNDLKADTNAHTANINHVNSYHDLYSNSNPFNVTYMIIPDFTVECIDTKIGTLQITIDMTLISQKIFTGNIYFNVLVHRPVHGDEPITIIPNIDKLSFWKKVDILFTNSNFHTTTVEAVQPINFGGMKKYFVGVQIGGKMGSSLIKWKSIYVELEKKGRNAKQMEILLNTFVGAPFVSKGHSQMVNSIRDNKDKMERYLNECIEAAQRWANKI
ncbi:hypothetical protein BMR1_02g03470 [Babesia microti strain RI]|uniref:J domain-containing protein n=1 Tax=Babesia microti (strain RI) TaxID=1133968 RepID=I7IGH0_BABMR|nr:hypothetical protein BMR1_02g03470 [Babesia microti strain RI]CCF73846.1 hypothetical protein BMR1_02g03470 [Babesia microti strain RI]|eukprot:XP_012648455.1 hypothetical protein BMR1_02g03470 [Babesia microti strain RI]